MGRQLPVGGEAFLRKEARRVRDARRGRLGAGRYGTLVKEVAAVIRLAFEAGATATLFGLEGPLRHGIRADLCLQGWSWDDADLMAREMLGDALRAVNAHRPTWDEGQPEWIIHAGTLLERTLCVRCHAPLPEGHFKFCSALCRSAHNQAIGRRKEAQGDLAVKLATTMI